MKSLLLCTLVLSCRFISGQINLVPNSDFETKISCPTNGGELYKALGWINANNGSPDYFHQCGNGGTGIPTNAFGYEAAHSGQAYAGFYSYNPPSLNSREYAEVQLLDTLEAGKKYLVTFWVSLADNLKYATSNIGAYFSSGQISCNQCLFPFIPQVLNPQSNPLSSKTGWTRIVDTLFAQGGELFMTIGNYFDDANSDTTYVGGPGWDGSYYYIDDVSVVDIGWVGINESNLNLVNAKLFPNPFANSTTLMIESYRPESAELIVYDVFGKEVKKIKQINTKEIVIERNDLPMGIYFYSLSEKNKQLSSGKLVVQD